MKTKFFGGIAIVAIALAVAFNVSLNTSKTNNASVLALANVEALASESSLKEYSCLNTVNYGGISFGRQCAACTIVYFIVPSYDLGKCKK